MAILGWVCRESLHELHDHLGLLLDSASALRAFFLYSMRINISTSEQASIIRLRTEERVRFLDNFRAIQVGVVTLMIILCGSLDFHTALLALDCLVGNGSKILLFDTNFIKTIITIENVLHVVEIRLSSPIRLWMWHIAALISLFIGGLFESRWCWERTLTTWLGRRLCTTTLASRISTALIALTPWRGFADTHE